MRKFVLNVGILGLVILLISSISPANAAVDTTKIGVNNGDEYIFVVDKYTSVFGENYSPGFFDPTVAVGSEFTMTILDATPTLDFFGDWVIEVNFDNGTVDDDYEVTLVEGSSEDDELGFIIFTDWDFWETEAKASLEAAKTAGDISSYSVENGADEFTVKTSVSISENEGSVKGKTVQVYEKSTGVLLYEYAKIDANAGVFSINYEDAIRRKGFTAPASGSDDGFLPGFGVFLTFSTLSLMILIIRKKK